MKWNHKLLLAILALWPLLFACERKGESSPETVVPASVIKAPDFNSDSAFYYIERQVAFGPRVPGTPVQEVCAQWLSDELRRHGATVTVQETKVKVYNGKEVPCYNIIGSFNPDAQRRILLGAHWDTRPFADQDPNRPDEPIDGANDGASGVGVLLEIARQLGKNAPNAGVDIIFFDVEDYGVSGVEDSYCLGSQYWAKNPHIKDYTAQNGVLLDMVGAKNSTFALEGNSMRVAPELMRYVWNRAHDLGHGRYFIFKETGFITDDHVYVYKFARIPMIDIIHYEPATYSGFGRYWHTHDDNMSIISRETLQAVGETVLSVVYEF